MRKYRKVLKDELEDVICDICKKSCTSDTTLVKDASMAEFASLEGIWGYSSQKDGAYYLCEMCENCFDKVDGFIESLKFSK